MFRARILAGKVDEENFIEASRVMSRCNYRLAPCLSVATV
jgi:hypothetical protein